MSEALSLLSEAALRDGTLRNRSGQY